MLSQVAQSRIYVKPEQLGSFCRRWGIQKLEIFGSALRDDFRAESDIDLLYTAAPNAKWGFAFVRLREELSQLLGKPVDLVARDAVERSRNPVRRDAILSTAQVLYEA